MPRGSRLLGIGMLRREGNEEGEVEVEVDKKQDEGRKEKGRLALRSFFLTFD
jgi:hypothetical protein